MILEKDFKISVKQLVATSSRLTTTVSIVNKMYNGPTKKTSVIISFHKHVKIVKKWLKSLMGIVLPKQ